MSKFRLRVKRPDTAPTEVTVDAPTLERACELAQEAGWQVVGQVSQPKAPTVPELTRQDIERAVFRGSLRALLVILGLVIVLAVVLNLALASLGAMHGV